MSHVGGPRLEVCLGTQGQEPSLGLGLPGHIWVYHLPNGL